MKQSLHLMRTLLLLGTMAASNAALADPHHGHHGGHGGPHIGFDFYVGPPYVYSYPYPYYVRPYYPPVVVAPAQPPVYVEQNPAPVVVQPPGVPQAAVTPQASNYWYHCDNPSGYYPYIKECPGGWQQVSPTPPPQ